MALSLAKRIDVLVQLGRSLKAGDERMETLISKAHQHNGWFTVENIQLSLEAIIHEFLDQNKLEKWTAQYAISDTRPPQKIGLILAGNIPLVGFQDVVNVFIAGHHAHIKLSDKDKFLLPALLLKMAEIDATTAEYFTVVERLSDFDAVIATGSNNSARYFEAYFGKYPNIIRKNRTSVAILTGKESEEDLKKLGIDVFRFFGLGCRNVSKLYVPRDYDFTQLLEIWKRYEYIIHHNKYKNNFDYNYSLLILNGVAHQSNGSILLQEDTSLHSRIASLHYEYYDKVETVTASLAQLQDAIQCVVAGDTAYGIPFGTAQNPSLHDYADGIDTMKFLLEL